MKLDPNCGQTHSISIDSKLISPQGVTSFNQEKKIIEKNYISYTYFLLQFSHEIIQFSQINN